MEGKGGGGMKVKKYFVDHIKDKDQSYVHYDGCFQPGDVALCGHDLMGDGHTMHGGWLPGKETTKKVNCPSCLRIIEHVKYITNPTK